MLGGVARRLKRGIDAGDEPGRGLLPGPGPRDPRGPRARRAAGARGVRREGPRDGGRRPQGRARPALRPARAVARSRPTGPGSWSTAGSPAAGPRRSAARSARCAARSGRWPATWSTRSACPRRCCAAPGPDRAAMRLPGLGGWSDDPLWGSFYDWTVEHPRVGGALWAARDPERPAAAVRRRRRDRPAADGRPGARRPVRRRGRAARAAARARASSTSPPTSPSGCSTGPSGAAASAASPTRSPPSSPTSRTLPFEDAVVRPGRLVHRPALLPRPGTRGGRDGPGAQARRRDHRQRAAQRHRAALRADAPRRPAGRAARPGLHRPTRYGAGWPGRASPT